VETDEVVVQERHIEPSSGKAMKQKGNTLEHSREPTSDLSLETASRKESIK
jgi:hypothetical protein